MASIWAFIFYRLYQESEATRQRQNQLKSDGAVVNQGKQDIRLIFHDLEGFYVGEDYAVASQPGGEKYYLTQSQDKIEKSLPATDFYRLNSQYIVHMR